MKRLLIPFLALALCPPAQAWERFYPDKGYQYCVEHILQGWNRQKGEWNSKSYEDKLSNRAAAHKHCR